MIPKTKILLSRTFLLKCTAWVFCFVTVVLLCAFPYWSPHEIKVGKLNKGERDPHQYDDLPNLSDIDIELEPIRTSRTGPPLNLEYHVTVVASSTYLLILSVLIILYLVDRPPKWQMLIMIFFGAILNTIAAVLELIKHSEYSKSYYDKYGKYGYNSPDVLKPFYLIVLGIMLLLAGLTMSVDFILYFVLKQNEAVNE